MGPNLKRTISYKHFKKVTMGEKVHKYGKVVTMGIALTVSILIKKAEIKHLSRDKLHVKGWNT